MKDTYNLYKYKQASKQASKQQACKQTNKETDKLKGHSRTFNSHRHRASVTSNDN